MINVLIVEDEPLIAEAHQRVSATAERIFGGRGRAFRP